MAKIFVSQKSLNPQLDSMEKLYLYRISSILYALSESNFTTTMLYY